MGTYELPNNCDVRCWILKSSVKQILKCPIETFFTARLQVNLCSVSEGFVFFNLGHPFVILEDKENHRHMVPAPDPSESSDVSSDTNRIPNGMETGKFATN